MKPWQRITWRMALLIALVLVFLSYLRPEMTVDLASRLWTCF
jgi:hypothetical protein